MWDELIMFIVGNSVNVVVQTIKSLVTHKGGPMPAALVNAVAFSFNTYIIVIISNAVIPLLDKCLIVGACNLIGVYIVKLIEEKLEKDKLWKIEATVNPLAAPALILESDNMDLSYHYFDITKYIVFNFYCPTRIDTKQVREVLKKYDCKYFVTESQRLEI